MTALRDLTDSWAGDLAMGVIVILSSSMVILQAWRYCRRRMSDHLSDALYLIALDARMSLYTPFLSAIQYAVSWFPDLLYYSEVPISFLEGYLLCCLLALIVTDSGGLSAIQTAASERQANLSIKPNRRCLPVLSQFQLAQRALCVTLLFRPLWTGLGIVLQRYGASQLSPSLRIMFPVVSAVVLFHGILRCSILCKRRLHILIL